MPIRSIPKSFQQSISEAHQLAKRYKAQLANGEIGPSASRQVGAQGATDLADLAGSVNDAGIRSFLALYSEIFLKMEQLKTMMAANTPQFPATGTSGKISSRATAQNPVIDWLVEKLPVTDGETRPIDGSRYFLSATDAAEIKEKIQNGTFPQKQVAEAFQAFLQRVRPEAMREVTKLACDLMESGLMPAQTLFSNRFLQKLKPARQLALARALAQFGPLRPDGMPRSDLMGRVLANVHDTQRIALRDFCRTLLRQFHQQFKDNWRSPEGEQVLSLLRLAGVKISPEGVLAPDSEQPFPLSSAPVVTSGEGDEMKAEVSPDGGKV